MTRATTFSVVRSVCRKGVVILALTVTACNVVPAGLPFGGATKSDATYSRGRMNQMWVNPPGALVMLQRDASGGGEQIIGLANETAMKGDNFLWVSPQKGRRGGLSLDGLVERVGGIPEPFRTVDNSNLRSGQDSQGDFFWQEYRSGAQTNCVLAFRNVDRGGRSYDMFLRNCVDGSIDDALVPIRDGQVAYSSRSAGGTAAGGNRNLSPLAAPL
ncbi:hypothetical protein [Oceaniglobus indicus]|uniref:hypothetical protein n=1 Tax=Oceaniglobus indicus TaxID=2047749 RepID=UPI000C185691|nr:hypothetical protein [Oceaniglobus indicus]